MSEQSTPNFDGSFRKKTELIDVDEKIVSKRGHKNHNNAIAKIVVAILLKNRCEFLYRWRIPVEFEGVVYSTENFFLNMLYGMKS